MDPTNPVKQSNLCGSSQADEFWTDGYDSVWGSGGNDLVHARNGAPDVIYGGAGNNVSAYGWQGGGAQPDSAAYGSQPSEFWRMI